MAGRRTTNRPESYLGHTKDIHAAHTAYNYIVSSLHVPLYGNRQQKLREQKIKIEFV